MGKRKKKTAKTARPAHRVLRILYRKVAWVIGIMVTAAAGVLAFEWNEARKDHETQETILRALALELDDILQDIVQDTPTYGFGGELAIGMSLEIADSFDTLGLTSSAVGIGPVAVQRGNVWEAMQSGDGIEELPPRTVRIFGNAYDAISELRAALDTAPPVFIFFNMDEYEGKPVPGKEPLQSVEIDRWYSALSTEEIVAINRRITAARTLAVARILWTFAHLHSEYRMGFPDAVIDSFQVAPDVVTQLTYSRKKPNRWLSFTSLKVWGSNPGFCIEAEYNNEKIWDGSNLNDLSCKF